MWQSSGKALHVVFGMSAASSLRRALDLKDCREEVIGFPDDLSFGPINPPSPDIRSEWIGSVLGFDLKTLRKWQSFSGRKSRRWKELLWSGFDGMMQENTQDFSNLSGEWQVAHSI